MAIFLIFYATEVKITSRIFLKLDDSKIYVGAKRLGIASILARRKMSKEDLFLPDINT